MGASKNAKGPCMDSHKQCATFVGLLKVCAEKKDLGSGVRLHADLIKRGSLEKSPYLTSTLITMYAKCGEFAKAQEVLDGLHVRDVVTWSALIAGYAEGRQCCKAISMFSQMQREAQIANEATLICILKACANAGAIDKGKQIHNDIVFRGLLLRNILLGNSLIDMYSKCGAIGRAQKVFEDLPVQNVVSWNTLIAGYVLHQKCYNAFASFSQMGLEGFSPDEITFTCILKACGITGDIVRGKLIHDDIICKRLLEKNIMLGNSLVDMYAKSGALVTACQVFQCLSVKNLVTWNSLISGYVQHEQFYNAINCFALILREGLLPNKITISCILKACSYVGAIYKGKQIHNQIVNGGLLEIDVVVGAALVDMYAKCGILASARQVHVELSTRDTFSWSVLISAYVQHDRGNEALHCFAEMQSEGHSPNEITYASILKACGSVRDIDKGKQIHGEISGLGLLGKSVVLGSAVVDMYVKCGMLGKAHDVIWALTLRDTISWNILITGYVQDGCFHKALECYEHMKREGLSPNSVTLLCILKIYGSIRAVDKGKEIHNVIITMDLLMKNIVLGTALVEMYARCGLFSMAKEVLEELPVRDTVCWNGLIAGYVEEGKSDEAFNCFMQMQTEGLSPNDDTFICILKACNNIGDINKGKEIHGDILNSGVFERNVLLGTTLVDMYVKCGLLKEALEVFEGLPVRDTTSWNTFISGLVQEDRFHEALNCFEQMQTEGLSPNDVTFMCILKACGIHGAMEKGKQIHDKIVSCRLLEKSTMLGTALVDMHLKCGVLEEAQRVFEALPTRDIFSWSALISGYAQRGQVHEALCCYERLQEEGLSPNEVTFVCMLKVCGEVGALDKGEEVHDVIASKRMLQKNIVLGNALVDMYAKCGVLDKAQQVLEELPIRDTASYNTLIAGYTQERQAYKALNCFESMQKEGINPDEITLLCMLNVFSHSGNSNEAASFYEAMNPIYRMTVLVEHHTCMVGIFGYAGCFDKAMSVIQKISSWDDPTIWIALLSACRKWGNLKLGIFAFDQAIQLADDLAAAYVLMGHVYLTAGMQRDADKVFSRTGNHF